VAFSLPAGQLYQVPPTLSARASQASGPATNSVEPDSPSIASASFRVASVLVSSSLVRTTYTRRASSRNESSEAVTTPSEASSKNPPYSIVSILAATESASPNSVSTVAPSS
jgi:hypothetical protein